MSLVLDAGALVAVERADRDTVALIKGELSAGRVPLAVDGDWVLTSDAGDLERLASAAGLHIDVVPV